MRNNIWLGTDGSGLFRFNNNSYVSFDETQGINSRIVMALAGELKTQAVRSPDGFLRRIVRNYWYKIKKIKNLVSPICRGKESFYRISTSFTMTNGGHAVDTGNLHRGRGAMGA